MSVQATDKDWVKLQGKFLLNDSTSQVVVFLEGPPPGTDILLNSLVIKQDADISVNIITNTRLNDGTNGWFTHGNCTMSVLTGSPHIMPPMARDSLGAHEPLSGRYILICKRDVILKFSGSDSGSLLGTFVRIRQLQNSFPFGSAIRRPDMENEVLSDFFIKNFNWALFGNELKRYWTEAQQGNFNCKDADELLDFCTKNNIQVRGNCIFWEVLATVQELVQSLNKNDLMTAVQNRLTGLLTR